MRFYLAIFLPMAFAVSACNMHAAGINTKPVTPTYKSEAAQERVAFEQVVAVRTYPAPAQGRFPDLDEEIAGASCAAESDEFKAKFITPAKVMLPIIKGEPGPLQIFCSYEGRSGLLTVRPGKNGAIMVGPSPAGMVAALVSAGAMAATQQWTYGDFLPVVIARNDGEAQ